MSTKTSPPLLLFFFVSLFPLHDSHGDKSKPITIALIGDSTVTDKSGWGYAFANRFGENVEVRNFAVGGRSSKSWYDEGRLPGALAAKPDYVFIQFGHNDQPGKGPKRETDPATTYRENLKRYIEEFKAIGAHPILVSSVTRRKFDESNQIRSSLHPWAQAARAVAQETDTTFLDLHSLSIAYHNSIGKEASFKFNPKETDTTHFNKLGAESITDLLLSLLRPHRLALNQSLKNSSEDL